MNKNHPILSMNIEDGVILSIDELINEQYLPVGISRSNMNKTTADIIKWWAGRRIPASRINAFDIGSDNIRDIIGRDDLSYLPEKCFGLSLSDQYWINPISSPLKWNDINFFENEFSEDMGKMIFDGIVSENPDMVSPDNTSDGKIRKKWKIIDGKRCLLKGYSLPYMQEPFNEKIASALCRRLNISNYTDYSLAFDKNGPFCICENFITPDTEYVTAESVMRLHNRDNVSLYSHYIKICEELEIKDIRDRIDEMLVVDYIIGNYDRHFRNFGLIRNVETLEFKGTAPIFDTGTSLKFNTETSAIFAESENSLRSKPFKTTHHEQIKLVNSPERFELLNLNGFEEEARNILLEGNVISPLRADHLTAFIKQRINLLNLYFSKRKEKDFFPFDKVTTIADKISNAINNGEIDNAEQSKGQER